jgi:hypothetical protein
VAEATDVIAAVVAEACRKDPSLPGDKAALLAAKALDAPGADAPEIARALLQDEELDVSWANAVATSVVELRQA